jgi:hypothetical protein
MNDKILELSSKLMMEEKEIAEELIGIYRKDPLYLQKLAEIERKIAVLISGPDSSIEIRWKNNKLSIK